jgi:hypothetical protein
MADKKISQLTPETAAAGDEIPVNRSGANFKITAGDIAEIGWVNPEFTGSITEEVFVIEDGADVDLDPYNGTIQIWTLGDSRTPTASNFAAGQSMTLMIDDGDAYAITWPSVTWRNNEGVAPTLSTTGFTVVVLWKVSTTLYGVLVGNGT